MPALIEADPQAIAGVKDQLVNASSAIDGQLQQLTGELSYLMTQWTGAAADAYLDAQSGWNGSMAEMHSILAQASSLLAAIAARYETTETLVVQASGA